VYILKSCADAVCEAIKSGYRLIDGAHVYLNEEAVGDGIARGIKEAGIKRYNIVDHESY
jgi:diketogulonate reductase-like aldo/keto reductase